MKDVIFDEQKQTEKSSYNPDVLSCLANLSNDEVFTPPEVANAMLDMLPQEIFSDKNAKFFDPACKSGVFLREIAKRLLVGLEKEIPDLQERVTHIFKKQLFAIAITELTSLLSRRSVYCSKDASGKYSVTEFENPEGNIFYKPAKHLWINGKCLHCGASQKEYGEEQRQGLETHAYQFIHNAIPGELENMKFDVIIGNPPYQMRDGGGTGSSATPIYQYFINSAKKLNPRYLSMIIPARWFVGGKGLDSFRETMLNDNRILELHDFGNSGDCFPSVAIEGGVCYFLWSRDKKGLCKVYSHSTDGNITMFERPLLENGSDVFIRQNEIISVIRKVLNKKEVSFSTIVSPRNPYNFKEEFLVSKTASGDSVRILGIKEKSRTYLSFPKATINRNFEEIKKYRLYISKADGAAGSIGYPVPARIIGRSEIGEPNTACTETFLRIGPFNNKEETENAQKYMETKFFRALVGARKGKNMTQSTYSFVPLQDFTSSSDIDWSKTIPEIDTQLYKKYELSEEEIKFIESMIRPME